AGAGGAAELCWWAGPTAARRAITLPAGRTELVWSTTIDRPPLWWPHALGDQPLVDVGLEVAVDGRPSDHQSRSTGLREIRMDDWVTRVNGERLFLKGSNQGPAHMALGEAPAAVLEADITLARQAGLDFLRLHAHISRPEIYDAADRLGVLIWQDLPLQWGYARRVLPEARRQARAAVDLIGHHPSVAIWCAHNEPLALPVTPGPGGTRAADTPARYLAAQLLPSFNKTVLDRAVAAALASADPTRPVVPHSGVLPHLGSGGTDSHFYFGWYHNRERDLPWLCGLAPRLVRFVSEFGAQAVPESAAFMAPERWPDLDWDRLERTHGLQRRFLARNGLAPERFATFDEWRRATQDHQATVVRHHVEHLRRLKYRPTGGLAQFCFADGHPAVSWSVLDHERVPKAGFLALAAACAPVIVTADRPAPAYRPGAAFYSDVHVVSDLRHDLTGAVVEARLAWEGGEAAWAWTGTVPADGCARVGAVEAVVPDAPG
ncbi:MAG: hypothetical protein ACRD0D_10570, partial [Acidimicrobiales bacterium]